MIPSTYYICACIVYLTEIYSQTLDTYTVLNLILKEFSNKYQILILTNTKNMQYARIQCFPGNSGLFDSISARIHPTDQTSTDVKCKEVSKPATSLLHLYINIKHITIITINSCNSQ